MNAVEMMLKSMGIDPTEIKQAVTDFAGAAQKIQEHLNNIELKQDEIITKLNGLERKRDE